jgi:hypothetical protein
MLDVLNQLPDQIVLVISFVSVGQLENHMLIDLDWYDQVKARVFNNKLQNATVEFFSVSIDVVGRAGVKIDLIVSGNM